MNAIWEALILGLIQGLTEFLPVSSSGHLEIAKYLLGDQSSPAQSLIMTVVLHLATALATIFVFRKDIAKLVINALSVKRNSANIYLFYILLSMIPAAIVGFFFESAVEALYNKDLILVGVALIFTAFLLVLADRSKRTDQQVTAITAILIGLAQAVAIVPGISRSGATISTSVLLKIDREDAARFSFLMVIPVIFGKIAKDLYSGELEVVTDFLPLGIGFIAAFITGIFACLWMIALVKKARLRYFGWYCALLGLLCIAWINSAVAHA